MDIADWRKRINEIDRMLVELLNERTRCAIEIGRLRHSKGGDLSDPAREQEVLAHVRQATQGPLDPDAVQRLFERIIAEARRAAKLATAKRKR